jgi:regulator of sirC expression with transglutaminase-like and TPR domain
MNLDAKLALLAKHLTASLDLSELALQLAQEEYPFLDVEAYLSILEGMAHEARPLLRGSLLRRVEGLCRYLFHDLGFRGNQANYYDARNSYLNEVLDRRLGIPITLSAVAMSVGGLAGLPVVGVGLPGHFVCKAVEGDQEVIFDPFHGGRLLDPEHCAALVEQITGQAFDPTPENLREAPLGLVVQRMLTNLKGIYLSSGDFSRAVRVMHRLKQLHPTDPLAARDLGVALVHAGQPGSAINHLIAYLRAQPHAQDAQAVTRFLTQAQAQVAQWN